jgi:hypothetical protein
MKPAALMTRGLFGPVEAIRTLVLERLVYGLLAFDLLVEMAPHGSRYGVGGMNVAHFAWLDALQPLPTATTYLTVVFAASVLSLALALDAPQGRGGARARWALFALYTYAWSMSQLDSYQHHVFLSIVLFALALSERGQGTESKGSGWICAWSYQMLMASIAIVYAYTGLSKMEESWRTGEVLIRINASEGKLEPFRTLALSSGLSEESFWWIGGHLVVAAQWVITAAYLAVFFDPQRRVLATRVLALVGLLTALGFHAGAEYLELRVGWFSVYMILLALIALGPAAPWRFALARARALGRRLLGGAQEFAPVTSVIAVLSLCVAALASFILIDLPAAAALGATALLVAASPWVERTAARARLGAASTALAVLVLVTVALTGGRAHYDYFRFLGGDLNRRGDPVAALEAYGIANTWAPGDEDRRAKAAKVRRSLPGALR